MVRNFPTGDHNHRNNPLRSRVFVFAFVVAMIAMVSFLCGKKKRKRPVSLNNHAGKAEESTENTGLLAPTANEGVSVTVQDKDNDPDPEVQNKELPPPPRLASIRATSCRVGETSNRSLGPKLTSSMSMSMRLSGRLKGLKKGGKNEQKDDSEVRENDKMTRENSLLNKTIILGGKCRIPDEDEDDIILDENGQRITTFHRKQSCSLSRQSSTANQDLVRNKV